MPEKHPPALNLNAIHNVIPKSTNTSYIPSAPTTRKQTIIEYLVEKNKDKK